MSIGTEPQVVVTLHRRLSPRPFATESTAALTVIRVALGLVIFPHGAQHLLGWFGGYGFVETVGWMVGDLAIPLPLAVLAVVTEFFAPLALVLGVGGRVAGLGIVGLMGVAASTHAAHGFFMNWFGTLPAGAEGFEYHILALAMGLAVAVGGSGAYSLDRVIARKIDRDSSGAPRRRLPLTPPGTRTAPAARAGSPAPSRRAGRQTRAPEKRSSTGA